MCAENLQQSKEYVVGQILQCLDEMCLALENKPIPGSEDMEPEEPGHFVTNVDKVSMVYGQITAFSPYCCDIINTTSLYQHVLFTTGIRLSIRRISP